MLQMNINFRLEHSGTQKLRLVKAIKEVSHLSLMEAKNIVDNCSDYSIPRPQIISLRLSSDELLNFKKMLQDTDAKYYIDDLSVIRRRKFLELGICDKSDLIEEITDRQIDKLISQKFLISDLQDTFINILSRLDEEQLKKILQDC